MSRCAFELLEAIRSGGPVWKRLYGLGMWEDLDAHTVLADSFNSLMATHSTALHPHVVNAYPWSNLGYVIDVGGGTGTLLAALATGHPNLSGKVVDLPLAIEGARRRFADSGLEGRLSVQEGNFFDPLPKGADVYIQSTTRTTNVCRASGGWPTRSWSTSPTSTAKRSARPPSCTTRGSPASAPRTA